MSVFPQFLDHIHERGMYVDGYNYEEMYNIMIYNLTYNIISTNNFIYTYAFMNQLYDYLEELLSDSDIEPDTEIETNNENNLPINDVDTIPHNQTTNQEDSLQLFQNYIITSLNNQNLNQNTYNISNINNNTNNTNNTNNEFTYTNLVYYNI